MIQIASWNVNSIKVRLPQVLEWLKSSNTDILFLQETKSMDENFPHAEFNAAGYEAHCLGQKSYNGVAVISRFPFDSLRRGMPLLDEKDQADDQARYIEISYKGFIMGGLYMPNGNPVMADDGSQHPKLTYKLQWMERLYQHGVRLNQKETPVLFCGDFNIIPAADDCWDIDHWRGDALHHPLTLAQFRRFANLGYCDIYRAHHPNTTAYSFWDYQGGAWQKDHGIRIDHIMTNPEATDLVDKVWIDKTPRGNERASDHTPIVCTLNI